MKNNALVLLWKGEDLPDYLVKKIAEILITNGICIPEMLTIKYTDETTLSNILINTANEKPSDIASAEAIKNSVIYIGERFKQYLGTANLSMFTLELADAVSYAKRKMSFVGIGSEDELLTAIKILSTLKGTIPHSLVRKYHFTQEVVDVIKNVYHKY